MSTDDRPLYIRKMFPRPEEDTRPLFLRKSRPRPTEAQPGLTRAPAQPVPPRLLRGRLEGLLRSVHTAPHGRRNDTLHWAACRVGEMLVTGELTDPHGAANALTVVALATGLDPREVRGTIRSGFTKCGVDL